MMEHTQQSRHQTVKQQWKRYPLRSPPSCELFIQTHTQFYSNRAFWPNSLSDVTTEEVFLFKKSEKQAGVNWRTFSLRLKEQMTTRLNEPLILFVPLHKKLCIFIPSTNWCICIKVFGQLWNYISIGNPLIKQEYIKNICLWAKDSVFTHAHYQNIARNSTNSKSCSLGTPYE